MTTCRYCGNQEPEGATQCSRCGKPPPPTANAAPRNTAGKLVVIQTFADEVNAQAVVQQLEDAGIAAHITADDCGGMLPTLQLGKGIRLLVAEADADTAQSLVANFENARPLPEPELAPASGQPRPDILANNRPNSTDSPRPVAPFLGGLLTGALLIALGGFILRNGFDTPRQTPEWDYNHDGRPDAWFEYQKGEVTAAKFDRNGDGRPDDWSEYRQGETTRSERDRNGDGRPDEWTVYQNDLAVRQESDDNFDSRPDGWLTFSNGIVSESRSDRDFDGQADVTTLYSSGVPTRSDWIRTTGTSPQLWKQTLYQHGLLQSELLDTNDDGQLDTQIRYDPFENEIGRTRLP